MKSKIILWLFVISIFLILTSNLDAFLSLESSSNFKKCVLIFLSVEFLILIIIAVRSLFKKSN